MDGASKVYGLGRPSFFTALAGAERALSATGGACCPGRIGSGIGFIDVGFEAPSWAARGLRLLILGTSKCSWGRPRGGRAGLHVGVAAEVGLGDSTRLEVLESLEISSLRRDPPFLGMGAKRPPRAAAASDPSIASSAGPSLLLLAGEEGGNCCESVRWGGGRCVRLAELKDLWGGCR